MGMKSNLCAFHCANGRFVLDWACLGAESQALHTLMVLRELLPPGMADLLTKEESILGLNLIEV